jgi:hypothetical protein
MRPTHLLVVKQVSKPHILCVLLLLVEKLKHCLAQACICEGGIVVEG